MHRYLIPIIFLFSPAVDATGIYHWVDDEGRTHYGDSYTPGAEPLEISVDQPNAQQLKTYREQQQALKRVITQQAAERKEMQFQHQRTAQRIVQRRVKAQRYCTKLHDQLDSVEASWEVKRRRGYQAADKRNYTARRDRLREDITESCR